MAAIEDPEPEQRTAATKRFFGPLSSGVGCQVPLDFGLATTAVSGTSAIPWPSAAFAQRAMRSIETGSALAVPMAVPRSRAIVSSRPNARSLSAAVATASMVTSDLAKATLLAPGIWLAKLRGEE